MSRNLLWIMTIFLGLAMIALVLIQSYWFRKSIETEQEQFTLLVDKTLTEMSSEIIQNEAVMTILEEIQPPVSAHPEGASWNYHIDARSIVKPEKSGQSTPMEQPHKGEKQHEGEEELIVYTTPHSSIINQTIEIIGDSVIIIIGEDEYMSDTVLVSAMKPEEIRMKLRQSMAEQKGLVNSIVRKMLVEDEDLEDRITQGMIQNMLKENLEEKGVEIPFEFAVFEKSKEHIFASEGYVDSEEFRYYKAILLSEGIFQHNTMISLYFPDEDRQLLRSLGVMGISSALITIFVLTLFVLVIIIIFKQKRLSEMKNDFVNNMTHELKTPISTISLAAQMLGDKSIPDEQKNLAQITRIVHTESKQLGFQVERVLQMAIFDHGQLKLKLDTVNMHDLIETVAQNFLLQVGRREGKLEFLPEAENDEISGDAVHLTNVISNLIENAMKYTRQKPGIVISTQNQDNTLVVSVSDNGIGIGKEDQKRIFDKFYRVPTGNIHTVKGFGLGLSYVKLIVERHNGHVGLKSEPGNGSRFDIHLPLQVVKSSE